jgi:hypothetical protein
MPASIIGEGGHLPGAASTRDKASHVCTALGRSWS